MEMEQQDTVLLNNLGVDCLRRGDFSQAPDLLRDALKETLLQYQRHQQRDRTGPSGPLLRVPKSVALSDHSMSSGGSSSEAEESDDTSSMRGPNIAQSAGASTRTPNLAQLVAPIYDIAPAKSHYIYEYFHSQALYLPLERDVGPVLDKEKNAALQACVMLYNLGLLFHLKAIEEGDGPGSKTRLQKAMALYSKANDMLNQASVFPTNGSYSRNHREQSQEHLTDFLFMAILNNISCALHQLNEYDAAHDNLLQLVQLVVSLPPTSSDDVDMNMAFLESTKSNFLLNSMTLTCPDLAAAA